MTLHRMMLIVILIAGFGLGLGLPVVRRHLDEQHAKDALQIGREVAKAEQEFFAQQGFYTADFSALLPMTPCETNIKDGNSVWMCKNYTFSLEDAQLLQIHSDKYPQWFTVSLETGSVTCQHEEGSIVGEKLCTAAHVPNYI